MVAENTVNDKSFSRQVGISERRKIKSIRERKRSAWSGFGFFGIVGWSVAIPTLLGAALGWWLDRKYEQSYSWTLTFMLIGVIVGCLIAWRWVKRESQDVYQSSLDQKDE